VLVGKMKFVFELGFLHSIVASGVERVSSPSSQSDPALNNFGSFKINLAV
jgi:hypothetical protein